MSKRAATVLVGAILVWLAAPLVALAAEPCAPLDLNCHLDEVIDPDPVPPVTNPVDEIVDEVEPVVDDVGNAVDDLLGGGGVIDPPGGGVIDLPGGGGGGGGDHGSGPRTGGSGGGPAVDPSGVVSTAAREGGSTTEIIPAAGGTREAPVGSALPPGGIVQAAITGALLLLGLFAVTVGFLLLQDRLDRGDPKLAIAPVRAEMVTFE